ncbi:hypothetical protein PIB30_058645 [Stylosanthes scabra]|uniref:Uncharacterized protein n=1 Tax=Stylosanthes scabra TaxID=79078 RepID=A0ABU6VM26_9FABA|nr:hypothetical protein [Stylosanthes scabra]
MVHVSLSCPQNQWKMSVLESHEGKDHENGSHGIPHDLYQTTINESLTCVLILSKGYMSLVRNCANKVSVLVNKCTNAIRCFGVKILAR